MNFILHNLKTILLMIGTFVFVTGLFTQSVSAIVMTRPVSVQNVTTTSADIIWKSDTAGSSSVKYGTTNSYELGIVNGINGRVTIDGAPGYLHRVTVRGLSPNTKYYYQVLTSNNPLTPAGDLNYFIKTSPVIGSSTPFSWIIWGDSGNNSNAQKAVAAQVYNKKPELVLIAGDVAYGAGYGGFVSLTGEPQQDQNHFDIYSNITKFSPFYLACGNHDNNDNNTPVGIVNGCDVMIDEQVMPNGGRIPQSIGAYDDVIYSFDYGNVHFTVLNTNGESPHAYTNPNTGSPQMLWAYQDIRSSNQPWKVVMSHTNAWSSGSHSTNTSVVNGTAKMAQDAGANVYLVGHSHVYERFSRFAGQGYGNCNIVGGCRDKGPYYFTIGNGGQSGGASSCGSYTNGPQCIAASGIGAIPSGAGFLQVIVNGDIMTFNYIGSNGVQYDSNTIYLSEFGSNPSPLPTSTIFISPTKSLTPTPTAGILPSNTPFVVENTQIPSPLSTATPRPCPEYSTNLGAASSQVNLPVSGSYKVWSRVNVPDDLANSYLLKIDDGCVINVGGQTGIDKNNWIWIDYQDGNSAIKTSQYLESGEHTIQMIGKEAGVKLDKILFTTDMDCQPVNSGENCEGVTSTMVPSEVPTTEPTAVILPTATNSPSAVLQISRIKVSNITVSEAIINWNTSLPGTSKVVIENPNSALPDLVVEDIVLKDKHTLLVSGLQSRTRYYYRVYSRNASGVESQSSRESFQTRNK